MCGIAGFVGKSSGEVLRKLQEGVRHRGPDNAGILLKDTVGLAHARLSIIDTSPAGNQPMLLPDESAAIILNGEIYNYKELRKDLERQGCSFKSNSDTEVLLWLYAREGEDFLKKCTGMFALALYDFKQQKLILARDRMGEKPLYWTRQGGTLFFASELSALLRAEVMPRRIDTLALSQYLAFDAVPTPGSIIEGVSKLEPATCLLYEKGKVRKKVFWELPNSTADISEEEALKTLDQAIATSVSGQLVSDVPLGVFLSGGIDSSTVAYYASRARGGINTFSIGFDEPSFDESQYAREVADVLGTQHNEHRFSVDDALALIPEIPNVFSEPVADASVLPTMLLSKFARQSVTVALGGDGGDELFAGYPTFQADVPYSMFRFLPSPLRALIRRIAGLIPASDRNFSPEYLVKRLIETDETNKPLRHLSWLGTFTDEASSRISGNALQDREKLVYEQALHYAEKQSGDNGLLWMYARTYLMDQVLVKVDRASMHYALETRAPFLDHSLVEQVFSLPYEFKYRNGTTKYLLKKLMRDKLPPSIVRRRKKGFGIPLARWLKGSLRPLCEELLSEKKLDHGFFNIGEIKRLQGEHMEGVGDRRKELWNLMVFQLWYDTWFR